MKKMKLGLLLTLVALSSCSFFKQPSSSNENSNENQSNSEGDESSFVQSDTSGDSSHDQSSITIPDDYRQIDTHDEDKVYTCPNNSEMTYEDLFDLHNKVNISIKMDKNQILKLKSDFYNYAKSDIYRIAKEVTISLTRCGENYNYSFNDVGIRLKGNMSLSDPFDDSGNLVNQSHYKLSFGELFDDVAIYGSDAKTYTPTEMEERKNRNLLGLEKLDIKWNRTHDASHVKEIYAYEIYRANGLLVPHVSLANLDFNDGTRTLDLGVCSIYETIDKEFIKRNLDSNQSYLNMGTWNEEKAAANGVANSKYGDLYKVTYGRGSGGGTPDMTYDSFSGQKIGEDRDNGAYVPVYNRKTNKGTDNNDRLRTALETLNSGSYNDIAQKIDLQYFARLEAINYLVGDPDDLRNNYNNYYLYIRRTDGKMIIIPYDHDRVFGLCEDWNPSGNGMSEVEMYSRMAVGNGGQQVNPLYLKTILASSSNQVKTDFDNYCKALKISRWFTTEKFNIYYQLAEANYGEDYRTSEIGGIRNNEVRFSLEEYSGNLTFENYVNRKLKHVSLEDDDGNDDKPIKPVNGNFYLVGDFSSWEALDKYKFTKSTNDNIYNLDFKIDKSYRNSIEFKINDGNFFGNVDYGFDEDFNIVEGGPNGVLSGFNDYQKICFTLDLNEMKLNYSYENEGQWTDPSYDYYFAFEGNGWAEALNNEQYLFSKINDDIYQYEFTSLGDYNDLYPLKFKIMCSNGILYGNNGDNSVLYDSATAQTFKVYELSVGEKLNIVLNVANAMVSVAKADYSYE